MTYALADFGSTFTKVSLADARGHLLSTAQHPTTVATDVMHGYRAALSTAMQRAGLKTVDHVLAASSAAGGLRMVAVGLVDDLTASAARRAALSAGAKVEGVWSGRLGTRDAQDMSCLAPDLILFAGGTDGGDRERVLANARVVATVTPTDVVVACNADVAGQVCRILADRGHHVVVADNVLPRVDVECAAPAREAIRELFIQRVVYAKGLSSDFTFFETVVMPTPAAVLACAELLGSSSDDTGTAGGAMIIDVGGATTDLHSVLPAGRPGRRVKRSGPAPSHSARTVEGDLGVRWNADTVYRHDQRWITSTLGLSVDVVQDAVDRRKSDPGYVPDTDEQRQIDRALASSCIATGAERHVGRLSTTYVPGDGADVVLTGRDLQDVHVIIVTGGSLVRDDEAGVPLVKQAFARLDPSRPVPRSATVLVDTSYVLAAAGLLCTTDPVAARRLLLTAVPGLANALTP